MEEDNEDGKSPALIATPDNALSSKPAVVALAESVELAQPTVPVNQDGESAIEPAIEVVEIPMDDEYEAYIRQMNLSDWLAWKAEFGYMFNLP
jgi:hypothetical protein